MKREPVAMVLFAVGLGLAAGALYEAAFGIQRTVDVCEEDGACTKHYAAPQFALLILALVLTALGAGSMAVGARLWLTRPEA